MTKLARFALAATAVFALAACGSSESAKEEAQADNVEMPAEEAVGDVDAAATPVSDAAATPAAEAAAPSSEAAAPSEAAPQ